MSATWGAGGVVGGEVNGLIRRGVPDMRRHVGVKLTGMDGGTIYWNTAAGTLFVGVPG